MAFYYPPEVSSINSLPCLILTWYPDSILLPSGSEQHEVLSTGSILEGILRAPHFR